MAKVLYHVTMSLDGFIAGPGHSMDWLFGAGLGRNDEGMAVVDTTGAAIAGRNGYEAGRKVGGELFGGAWHGPIFVLTHQPPTDETRPEITFLSGDIRPIISTAMAAADGKDVLILGGTIARQCIEAGLLDEMLVHVAPMLLGDGIPLFRRTGPVVKLDPISSTHSGRSTNLRFKVVR
jgi:dihydrofolate reductase